MAQTNGSSGYETVDDIFKNLSISEIRSLEVDLRSQAASKRSALRQLVGESYRDLLTTADTIIEMRDKTVALRRQLNTLVSSCDSGTVSRKLRNLEKFPSSNESMRDRVLSSYVFDLRALLVHFLERKELLVATRLFSFGRLVAGKISTDKSEIQKTLKSARNLLLKAINRCKHIHDFACSFAILESATPKTALQYFLSLQLANLKACKTLQELAKSILQIVETSREFNRLDEVFDQISRRTLLSSVEHVVEVDFGILAEYLPEEICQYRPFMRSDNLSQATIQSQVSQWLRDCSSQTYELSSGILRNQYSIADIFKDIKQVRDLLDEASQLSLYEAMEPAVLHRIAFVLQHSLDAVSESVVALRRIITKAEMSSSLWKNRLPWTKGSLREFTHITQKSILGHSQPFFAFKEAYLPKLDTIRQNIEILGRSRENADRLEQYIASVRQTMTSILETLSLGLEETSDPAQIVQILRLSAYILRTSPITLTNASIDARHFAKLLPSTSYRANTKDYSAIFDQGLPITPSPAAVGYLFTLSTTISSIGIDIIGSRERALIGNKILQDMSIGHETIVAGVNGTTHDDPSYSSRQDHEHGTPDPTLPQNRADGTSDVAASLASSADNHEKDDEFSRDIDDRRVGDEELGKKGAIDLQDAFDRRYVARLLGRASSPSSGTPPDEPSLELHVDRAVQRSRVLYRTLTDIGPSNRPAHG